MRCCCCPAKCGRQQWLFLQQPLLRKKRVKPRACENPDRAILMAAPDVAELAFLSYCDVSYAGVRALVETIEWHKACGHDVVSQPLEVIMQSGHPSVPLPHLPSASATISTVTINGRLSATYAVVHSALLRTHAAAIAASVISELARRGARRIFLLSVLHQPLFSGLRCVVRASKSPLL